ncbi:MAG TPA: protein translocase subunit SecF [Candidatus Babeliales bacterium]|nr:protein translocase subunit SecF [Candidatus Babeliales bacterium]
MFDILKYRSAGYAFYLAVIVVFVGAYFFRGGFSYSVDFTGGTELIFRFEKPVKPQMIKDVLQKNSWDGVLVREFSSRDYVVRVRNFSSDLQGLGGAIKSQLASGLNQNNIEIIKIDSVGEGVGSDLGKKSMWAILLALLLMLLYIAIRFRFAYSIGAVVALAHDAFVIGAFFLLFNREISVDVVGAVLMTLGYSINDTIVIFARIRENLRNHSDSKSVYEIVNLSINQTLRRTILTSLSTALVVVSLIVLGGEALRGLSIALLLGIIFGTYSSIFIASPIMLMFYKNKKA